MEVEEAEEAGVRFDRHTRAVEANVQQLRDVFGSIRGARVEMSRAERLLSFQLLGLIASNSRKSGGEDSDEDSNDEISASYGTGLHNGHANRSGLVNEDGAWCWKEDCSGMQH